MNLLQNLSRRSKIALSIICALLIWKFCKSLWLFELPLGYDPGIYRYLFTQYADALPQFALPDMQPWAREHPPVLSLIAGLLMNIGIPVDWLIGWVWNVFTLLLLCLLACVSAKRFGQPQLFIFVLFAGLLSQAYYEGFVLMYWKTYAALFLTVLTFYYLQSKPILALFFALLTIGTHHQTALILILSLGSWWMLEGWKCKWDTKKWLQPSVGAAILGLIALLWYLPSGSEFVLHQFKLILGLTGAETYGGAFAPTKFFLLINGVLIALGIYGFITSFENEKGSVWQWAVVWSAVFVIFRLYFFRRFFLQLDFFLLPYAAYALWHVLTHFHTHLLRCTIITLLSLQLLFSYIGSHQDKPQISAETLQSIIALEKEIPRTSNIIVPENRSVVWVLGWLPRHEVDGPGLFGSSWNRENWKQLIFGSHEERRSYLAPLQKETVMVILPYFYSFYKEYANPFIQDPCLSRKDDTPVYRITCAQS